MVDQQSTEVAKNYCKCVKSLVIFVFRNIPIQAKMRCK